MFIIAAKTPPNALAASKTTSSNPSFMRFLCSVFYRIQSESCLEVLMQSGGKSAFCFFLFVFVIFIEICFIFGGEL